MRPVQVRCGMAQLGARQEVAAGTGKKIKHGHPFSLWSSKIQDHKVEHRRKKEFRARVQGSTVGGVGGRRQACTKGEAGVRGTRPKMTAEVHPIS